MMNRSTLAVGITLAKEVTDQVFTMEHFHEAQLCEITQTPYAYQSLHSCHFSRISKEATNVLSEMNSATLA